MRRFQRLKKRPELEALEDRCLLAAPITEFPISAGSRAITAGPDGNLWFTLADDQIGRITPTGQFTAFPIPQSPYGPESITPGPDGNIWFTYRYIIGYGGDTRIGRITPNGQVTLFPTSTYNHDIVAGPDGNLWYAEYAANKIGRISPAGQVTEFPVSYTPIEIKSGPDGNLWVTEHGPPPTVHDLPVDYIGRITPDGKVTESRLPGLLVNGATFGPDGSVWFTEFEYLPIAGSGGAERVGFLSRITPAGQFTDIRLTGPAVGGDLTFGTDGNPWFADPGGHAIGRITLTGLVAEFSIPTAGSEPSGIVAGPDGNMWFTEGNVAKLGRFRVSTTDLGLAIPGSTVTGTAGQPLAYTISVTNHGPGEATDVVLTEELPASTVPVPVPGNDSRTISASQGAVKQVVGGGFVAELGNLASGATATLTIVVNDSSPRTITSGLTVYANESDTNPGDDSATLTTIIGQGAASGPPHVLNLRSIRTPRKGLTAISVGFDEPMDSGHVSNVGIYHLVSVSKGKKPRLKVVGLASASYDTATHSVRLALKKPFKTGTLRLTIDHSTAVAANGMGLAGGDYVATVPR
jgi:uncharacterized repeat protein (TIGR01451 family)